MRPAHRGVARSPFAVPVKKEIFNHGARRKEIQACYEQLRIGRHSLEDGVREIQPRLGVRRRASRLIGVQERDQIADQEGGVH